MLAVEGLLPGSGPRKSCEVGKTIEEETPESTPGTSVRSEPGVGAGHHILRNIKKERERREIDRERTGRKQTFRSQASL